MLMKGVRSEFFRLERPKPSAVRPRWPLGKKPLMTIGIGRLCVRGAIIAADTRIAVADGSTQTARKIRVGKSAASVFVCAYASDDANAARTLLDDLFEQLTVCNPVNLYEVEEIVRPCMAKWAAAYANQLPSVQIILGASTPGYWSPDRKQRGGVGLYLCEPPNTMLMKHFLNGDASTYIGIGGGASITDPLNQSLFPGITQPKDCLKEIAYLMYRAKRDYGQYCGGETNAVYLLEGDPPGLVEVVPIYMDKAEAAGAVLDTCLKQATAAALASTLERSEEYLKQLRSSLGLLDSYRKLRFVTWSNEEICEDGFLRDVVFDP